MIKVNHKDQQIRNINSRLHKVKYPYKLLLITTKIKDRQYKISIKEVEKMNKEKLISKTEGRKKRETKKGNRKKKNKKNRM